MKYGFPLGHTMIFLALGMIDYKDAYVAAGEYENGLNAVRWGTDWILKVYNQNIHECVQIIFMAYKLYNTIIQASKEVGNNIVYAQVGDTTTDHDYWGRPEEFPTNLPRPAMSVTAQKPGLNQKLIYICFLFITYIYTLSNMAIAFILSTVGLFKK